MRITSLLDGWTFRRATPGVGYMRPHEPATPWRPATVPGCVHDDLIRAGVISNPFEREFEAGCQWVDEEDWTYRTSFQWTPSEDYPKRTLQFEGLDTVCSIWLNGVEIGRGDNMFLPVEIDVSEALRPGENELEVRFESAVRIGMERRRAYFESEGLAHSTTFFDERAFVRKAQFMSGWDWGPRLVSCGIWRPVRLLEFESRIASFTVFQERLEDGKYRVWSESDVEGGAALTTSICDREFEGDFECVIEDPHLWWPHGMGEPFLYEARARLATGQEVAKRIGLRTVELIQEPDDKGTSFEFAVNGRRVFALGANWISNDSFPSRVTEEDYREQIAACTKLGMNMLRVWGGGLYESDAFYDACDEMGVLVWQDFPFACSYYPDSPAHRAEIEREAEFHVRRLRDRASLALWCGNNENDVMWEGKWGGAELAPERYCGDCLYEVSLNEVCGRLDPSRPYLRSSPIGGQEAGRSWGDTHYWDVWHGRGDWRHYAESKTRFCSEFGFASACSAEAWRLAGIEPDLAGPEDLPVRWHDKTNKPWDVFRGLVELHYPPSNTLEDWVYYGQLNQRDALRLGIEHFRTSGFCRGTLLWQFNDCWPVQSWAVQDYARRVKPAGFELQRLHAPALLSLKVEGDEIVVCASNEGPGLIQAAVEVEFFGMDGSKLSSFAFEAELGPGEPHLVARIPTEEMDKAATVVRGAFLGRPESATWRTLAEPKEMRWAPPRFILDGSLLKVGGLAYDLVLLEGARMAEQCLPGTPAVCVAIGSIALELEPSAKRLRLRTMAGMHELSL